ncbi:hypothetical protein Tco_0086638 [Tanacetum coccineum]
MTISTVSTAFFSNFGVQDFQDDPHDEYDMRIEKDYEAESKKVKAKLALLTAGDSNSQPLHSSHSKNKGLVVESHDWNEEEISSDDEEMVTVKVLMALADDEKVERSSNIELKELVFVRSSTGYEHEMTKDSVDRSKPAQMPN